ncbi:MAG TPA: hypothetical protein VK177_01675, partial [Flavobacteriales bacterium]|nr:hypothetical protein [Flavobacteriales bacterium]
MNQRITFFWWFAAKPPALFYLLFKGEPCAAHCTYFNIIPFAVNAWGNTAIDSLRKLGHTARHDTTRINAFILAGENFYPDYPDSCTIYWEKAIQLCDKALKKHGGKTKTRLLVLKAAAINNIAIIYTFSGQTQLALDWNFKALKIREAAKNDHG